MTTEIEELKDVRSSVYDSIKFDIIERYGKICYEDYISMIKFKGKQEVKECYEKEIAELKRALNKRDLIIDKQGEENVLLAGDYNRVLLNYKAQKEEFLKKIDELPYIDFLMCPYCGNKYPLNNKYYPNERFCCHHILIEQMKIFRMWYGVEDLKKSLNEDGNSIIVNHLKNKTSGFYGEPDTHPTEQTKTCGMPKLGSIKGTSSNGNDSAPEDVCENCGHTRKEHEWYSKNGGEDNFVLGECGLCAELGLRQCKQFKPKKKGCGEILYEDMDWSCGDIIEGKITLCPDCQKKKGCGKEIYGEFAVPLTKVKCIAVCGKDTDVFGNIILCPDCQKKKEVKR